MNKADLVAKVADKTGFKKKDAEMALDAVLESQSRLPRLLYSRQASPLRMLSISNLKNKEMRIAQAIRSF